ncbi:hypothetical protein IWQ62_003846 [Dispira parvispora]|uniref:EngB-type G domain-containing protein n=1 Tax=Dispira parvispora TaxID=1520584 RepID=A0A9W8E5Y3_9FUNG|nr:hypothetical protein IWQ62_003846 [Dispira parvispora]
MAALSWCSVSLFRTPRSTLVYRCGSMGYGVRGSTKLGVSQPLVFYHGSPFRKVKEGLDFPLQSGQGNPSHSTLPNPEPVSTTVAPPAPVSEDSHLYQQVVDTLLVEQYGKRGAEVKQSLSNRKKLMAIKPTQHTIDTMNRLGLGRMTGNQRGRNQLKRLLEAERDVPFPHLRFFAGAKTTSSFPEQGLPEVAFVGRSNVGKSTLINALARTSIVRTSDKPGLTQQINFYEAEHTLNLIDMPGYGFAFAKDTLRRQWHQLPENITGNA